MEKIQLLETLLGRGHKANRDYYQFMCPFHHGRNGPKLGVSMGTGGWKCWVCPSKGSSVGSLIRKLNGSREQLEKATELWKEKTHFKYEPLKSLHLPKEFKPLWEESGSFFYQKAIYYLGKRSIQEGDVIKHRLGFCESGRFDDMIVMPSYSENGQLNFYQGRTFNEMSSIRFKIPENLNKDEIVFDEILINWHEPVILVEGKLDAIAIRRNAYPLNGKKINTALKNKILSEQCPEVIFCLDGDALSDAMLQAEYFLNNGITVSKVNLPNNHDPSSLGYVEVWKHINNAEPLNECKVWQWKMKNKLKI